jgi:hypothetical protein
MTISRLRQRSIDLVFHAAAQATSTDHDSLSDNGSSELSGFLSWHICGCAGMLVSSLLMAARSGHGAHVRSMVAIGGKPEVGVGQLDFRV